MLDLDLYTPCLMPRLKTVTIIYAYNGHCQGLIRLAEFLLKHAVNLDKMVIFPSTYNVVADLDIEFVELLSSFSKASTNAKVVHGSSNSIAHY